MAVLQAALPSVTTRFDLATKVLSSANRPIVFLVLAALGVVWEIGQRGTVTESASEGQSQRDEWPAGYEERVRQALIVAVRRQWISGFLDRSLELEALIELGLESRPAALEQPWGALANIGRGSEPLPAGTTLSDLYDEYDGKLLVLGEPGAGKTTALLELGRHLLEQAEVDPDEPIPVVFHLSSWTEDSSSLVAWLVDELVLRYGISRPIARRWMETDGIAPLLDGLDEVAPSQRSNCVEVINAFLKDHSQRRMVICSRLRDYESLNRQLRMSCAVLIRSLDRKAVELYLRRAGRQMAGVRAALVHDEQLWALLTTPLMLSIVALTYKNVDSAHIRSSDNADSRRSRLLADYVTAMLARPRFALARARTQYTTEQTRHALTWLASSMSRHHQSVFYPDWLQPTWLPSALSRHRATVGPALWSGLVAAVGVVVIDLLFRSVSSIGPTGLIGSIRDYDWNRATLLFAIFGVVVSLAGFGRSVTPSATWQWGAYRTPVMRLAAGTFFGGLAYLLLLGRWSPLRHHHILIYGRMQVVEFDLLVAVVGGLAGGIAGIVVAALQHEKMRSTSAARNGLWTAAVAGATASTGIFIGAPTATSGHEGPISLGLGPYVVLIGIPITLAILAFTRFHPLPEVTPPTPGVAIRRTALQASAVGLALGIGGPVLYGLWSWLAASGSLFGGDCEKMCSVSTIPMMSPITIETLCGLGFLGALRLGLGDYLRYRATIRELVRHEFIPANFIDFLDHADSHILLRKAGGGYVFIHKLILDHFALRAE